MANTGLLVLTNLARIQKILPLASERVAKTLYVHYFPEKKEQDAANDLPRCARAVANIYTHAASLEKLDVRVLITALKGSTHSVPINTKKSIELVIFDGECAKSKATKFIQDRLTNASKGCEYLLVDGALSSATVPSKAEKDSERMYRNVVLGGTFDRLHGGHKILLSDALLHCSEKLTVGVTDRNMITGKVLWELIEPCEIRIAALRDFLEDVDPSVRHEVLPISDMYGPTRWDPDMELLVVSEETIRGAKKVNELRAANGLNELSVRVVGLACDEHHAEHEETKISSSNRRLRLLGTRLRAPRRSDRGPREPYVIGLTGGIASGKSSVAQKLESLNASIVNCDKIAHELYQPGERCFELIVKNFGRGILSPDGTIDRRALGALVFTDKAQLDKLNGLVWPAILEKARQQIESLRAQGARIIVMEAAVLIQAKWQFVCDEIWTCIVPRDEAVRRVVRRNSLSEDEARRRIDAQPSNEEQVAEATVVFSTLWSHDVTMQQIQRAWNELQKVLADSPKI